MKIYNTLTRQKETFKPITDKLVTMYSCGPTVYNYAHIGNLRTYLFTDLIRRAFSYLGYSLKGVMNITDVGHLMDDGDDGEDKMALASREEKKTPWEIAAFYTDVFFKDLDKLNIERPEIIANATDHIQDMIDFVQDLLEKGFAYETSDGIYFNVRAFPDYGKLSGKKLEEQVAGARVEVDEEKLNPEDFALWKKAEKGHIMQWPSPWGMGYPGWHIECSAMGKKYLGEIFDIHSGGVDHIPIHHENEIAQNEAVAGKQTVNYWMHAEFMLVDGGKMSKSLKNTYTIDDLEKRGYSALDFRFFCLNAHYRKKLNFTFDGMDMAKTARSRLNKTLLEHKNSSAQTPSEIIEQFQKELHNAIADDINAPLALGSLFTAIKEPKSADIYKLALEYDKFLGLSLGDIKEEEEEIPSNILDLANQRMEAKKSKNFNLADSIREQLKNKGYLISDTRDGFTIKEIKD